MRIELASLPDLVQETSISDIGLLELRFNPFVREAD
jgi:hypothetical protein